MSLFNESAEVLREMEGRGAVKACISAGGEARDTTDDEMEHHDVTISKKMPPTCESITSTEEELGKIAQQYNGRSDGWGFFSD